MPDQPAKADETVTAAMIVIGDEILSGRTKDKNIGYVADHLTAIGIQLQEVRIVPDVTEKIAGAVNDLRTAYTYVFTSGGIGPTHDDITADSVAAAFGVPIDVDPRAVAIMKPYYEERNLEFSDARMRMARMPEGADLIENAVSNAPGFMMENVIVMAGIPKVMQMMLDAVTPKLRTGLRMESVTIVLHRPESEISALLGAAQDAWPDVSMGSYPFFENGKYGTQLVLRSTDNARLAGAETAVKSELRDRGWISDEAV
ncbi:MAG: competence/damage-inducible protein A [Hyphomicrobiaceae bacterium]